uniref:C-type lectin domain-containing protein n=1 Tax=Astatotilapia calliptera TaxID=8154 RepID=A0AAX7U4X3_ASTCA
MTLIIEKTMANGIERPFFCYSASVVTEKKTWEEALEYCREHNDDLASVGSETEIVNDGVWFGLERNHSDKDKWLWSGGGALTWIFWNTDQPDNRNNENRTKGVWEAHNCEEKLQFICY